VDRASGLEVQESSLQIHRMEIEVKYRLAALPPKQILGPGFNIQQGYVISTDGELRIRRINSECYLTVKGEGGLSREEWEIPILHWVFETLWPHTRGRRLEKTRYRVSYEDLTIEVDEYHGRLKSLVTMECEFSTQEFAARFTLPSWASDAVDVTNDPDFKNKRLATTGIPQGRK
jgi:adenylate cyclase